MSRPVAVVLVAPGGLGKTMIAQNIAHRAVLAGRSVLFLSAAQLLLDLGAQESARALDRRLHYYVRIPPNLSGDSAATRATVPVHLGA